METHEESVESSKPRRPWMRWLKRIGKGLLLAFLAIVIRQAWHHHTVTKKLQETLAQMDRTEPGWRLKDIEAAREQVPEDENSARVVVATAELLPRGWPPPEIGSLFAQVDPERQLDADDFACLKQELASVRPALEEARKLTGMPSGRHRITYQRLVYETLLPDQALVRRIAYLLTCDALRYAQTQEPKAALTACFGSLNAARSIGDEPILISQLIRSICVINTCSDLQRVLAQGEPPPDEMASMQHSLSNEDVFPDMPLAARGERAALHSTFDAIESGDVPFTKLEGTQPNWRDSAFGWFSREKFREAHPPMLAMMNRFVSIAQLPMPEQAEAERQLDRELRALKETDPIAVLFIPAINKASEASRRKHAYLRCMMAALAAERYRRTHMKWPESLDQLCPHLLANVPLDPYDGEPLRFRRLEDGVAIYSVGVDAIDNGGNLDREHATQPGVDIGFRLWNVAKRRQAARPKPPALNPG